MNKMLEKPIQVNGERLWAQLMEMAQVGATEKGGCNRQALTGLDAEGRELFIKWCKAQGCSIRKDKMGNVFARRKGTDNSLPPVITGSHLDTQPTGGKFDGVYGVLAGLEVISTFNECNINTLHPIEVVVWTNEEGARFSPAMIGSGTWSGEFSLDYAWGRTDKQGISIKQALKETNQLGDAPCKPFPIKAAFELHIEQGPILEQKSKEIGIVKGVQGMRWFDLTLFGQSVHAGPTPMEDRRDPIKGISQICLALYDLVERYSPWARVTFGDIDCLPGARNTVPESVTIAVDLRHPEQEILEKLDKGFRRIVSDVSAKQKLYSSIREEWDSPAVSFDAHCIESVRRSVMSLSYPNIDMFSGAGHDAVYLSRVAPTSMIFIPCKDGISHNEVEYAAPDQIKKGADVLANAMLHMAVAE